MRFLDDFNTISSRRYFSDNYLREIQREEEREERRNIDFLVSEKFRIEKEISKHSKNSDVQSKVAVINFNKALKKIKNEIDTQACIKLIDIELKRREMERKVNAYDNMSEEELEEEKQKLINQLKAELREELEEE